MLVMGCRSASLRKNTVSAFHISCKLLSFTKIREGIGRQSILFHNYRKYLPYRTYEHTTFYQSSGLTRNLTFNGSIYYALYLQILHFYLVWQRCCRYNHQVHGKYVATNMHPEQQLGKMISNWSVKRIVLQFLLPSIYHIHFKCHLHGNSIK